MKKATDQEQETWVMPDPRYIAHISIFLEILPFLWQNEPQSNKWPLEAKQTQGP